MKKMMAAILIVTVLLGGTSYAVAASNENNFFSFEQMQPYIEQMHPNFSNDQQQEMFNDCHGENNAMNRNMNVSNSNNNF